MESETERGPASFLTQANALLRKNLVFQRHSIVENIRIISYPIVIILVLFGMQKLINSGNSDNSENNISSNPNQICPIQNPPKWPPLLQIPDLEFRATYNNNYSDYADLPAKSCRYNGSCPPVVLFTGDNQSIAKGLADEIFASSTLILGTNVNQGPMNLIDPAFFSERLYTVQSFCYPNSSLITLPFHALNVTNAPKVECVKGLTLWRESNREINDELFKGCRQSNPNGLINEFISAIDFSDSGENNYNVSIWYNSTERDNITKPGPFILKRVPRLINMVSNSYLRFFYGTDVAIELEFIKEMPIKATHPTLDFLSLLSPAFYVCVIELLLPVMLTYLVYEKQHKLRILMKMHGLGDGAYWLISYCYFFILSFLYLLLMVITGHIMGLNFFKLIDYSVQFVFYFIVMNLQILLAFILTSFFSDLRTAQGHWIWIVEIIPAFSLFGGLYELSQYAFEGHLLGSVGLTWHNLNDSLKAVMIINTLEWLLLLPIAYNTDRFLLSSTKVWKNIVFFKRNSQASFLPVHSKRISSGHLGVQKPDVIKEKETVEFLLRESRPNYGIICDKLRKIYPKKDGNQEKIAVQNLSLAVPYGECFGILGPNGAGKTTLINMLRGLTKPTSGNAYIQGLEIQQNMNKIYTRMGVCLQHDMLWEMLTGKEHLLFYRRLKNLSGSELMHEVDESLRSLDLYYHGGKQVRKYSGGMKRRLSVAISLIGNPKVVYLDEPSTGLDPASRKKLWNVVKRAKQQCAIILSTHSMEEAEFLCDRLGIVVNGSLQCIASPKELKARYGESCIFTMATSSQDETKAIDLVKELSPNAKKIYGVNGNQKFEIPKRDLKISHVFQAVEMAKKRFNVHEWSLTDTTMEDVFITVAKDAESPMAVWL